MKNVKILLFMAVSMITLSCSQDVLDESQKSSVTTKSHTTDTDSTHYVSYEKALENALDFLSTISEGTQGISKMPIRKKESVENHYEYEMKLSETDSISAKFHVINFENEGGFVLVSADNRTTPVFAFSDTGHLDMDEAMDNLGFKEYMNDADIYYAAARDSLKDIIIEAPEGPGNYVVVLKNGEYYRLGVEYETTDYISPIITAEWAQYNPYNYYCPTVDTSNALYHPQYVGKAAAGCIPIAMGQIMSHYEYPTSYGSNTYNWDYIKHDTKYYLFDSSVYSLETAKLLHDIGLAAKVSYGYQTGGTFNNAKKAFSAYGYSYDASSFNETKTYNSLNANRPIFIVGTSSDNGGHAWVIDGYYKNVMWKIYYTVNPPYTLCFKEHQDTNYFHCNWGWDGQFNGFYLNTFKYYYQGESISFTPNNIIYNIHPSE